MNTELTKMAFNDVRLVTFQWNLWLLPGDAISGTPVIEVVAPIVSGALVSSAGTTVTCSIVAGTFVGIGQVSCTVTTVEGEVGTRTAFVPVVPLVS